MFLRRHECKMINHAYIESLLKCGIIMGITASIKKLVYFLKISCKPFFRNIKIFTLLGHIHI